MPASLSREKPLHWVASAKRDYMSFPDAVQDEMGYALGLAQLGARHPNAKPWKGEGPGILEIVEDIAHIFYDEIGASREFPLEFGIGRGSRLLDCIRVNGRNKLGDLPTAIFLILYCLKPTHRITRHGLKRHCCDDTGGTLQFQF